MFDYKFRAPNLKTHSIWDLNMFDSENLVPEQDSDPKQSNKSTKEWLKKEKNRSVAMTHDPFQTETRTLWWALQRAVNKH